MVHYRRELLLERLDELRPESIVEIGCGSELLYADWLKRNGSPRRWIVVEPAEQFAAIARASKLPNLHVIQGYFEQAVPQVMAALSEGPDLVICSSLLHEVPSASELLKAIRSVLTASSILHVNVPNSESLHRRLAISMGLISSTKEPSERNNSLLQHKVYDMGSLREDLQSVELAVIRSGGYLIKPFTHRQMEGIASALGEQVLDGLFELGKKIPDLASEIYIEARKIG